MANQTGGDFWGGLPPAERKLLMSGSSTRRRATPQGLDDSETSNLSNARVVAQSPEPIDVMRPGWHPNLSNSKGA